MLEWSRCHKSTWTTSHTFYVQTINQPECYEALWTLKNKSLRKTKQIPMFTLDTEASLWSHRNDGYVHRCVKQVQSDQWEPHQASWKINTSGSSDRLRRAMATYCIGLLDGLQYVFVFNSQHAITDSKEPNIYSTTQQKVFCHTAVAVFAESQVLFAECVH